MGVRKYINQLGAGFANTKQLGLLLPTVKKIVKGFSKDEVHGALESDDKMREFAEIVYSKLPVGIKSSFTKDWFVQELVNNKEKLLAKTSNKKKIRKKK
ncbi:hypothetical protein LMH73_003655 [Vibrio splendidus]|nr:hypothetical protein [Vibrio splendidus]MCC4883248.1 hypothetical protein [Vibrio splendidus]